VFIEAARHAPLVLMLSCGGTTTIPADGGVTDARSNDAGAPVDAEACEGGICIPPVDALPPPPVDGTGM